MSWRSATCSRSSHRIRGGSREVPSALGQAAGLAGWRGAAAQGAWVAVVAATDPATLPDHTTWYRATNLPPGDAELAAGVRLYGLRMGVEQRYKQTKYALGWAQDQARPDAATRRHWQLVRCAFSFCWRQRPAVAAEAAPARSESGREPVAAGAPGRGGIRDPRPSRCWPVALRAVRAWREPWALLRRYWRAWSPLPPPPALAALLEYLRHGHGLDRYASP